MEEHIIIMSYNSQKPTTREMEKRKSREEGALWKSALNFIQATVSKHWNLSVATLSNHGMGFRLTEIRIYIFFAKTIFYISGKRSQKSELQKVLTQMHADVRIQRRCTNAESTNADVRIQHAYCMNPTMHRP